MKIILGLGNPSARYDKTWHNMGFEVIDELARRFGVSKYKKECESLTAHLFVENLQSNCGFYQNTHKQETPALAARRTSKGKIILAKPQTYMNLSGDSVYMLAKKYKVDLDDFLVISDDIDIARGEIRFRERGSGGTHNGLKNIIDVMGSGQFPRIKIGIGRGNPLVPLKDYVLRRLSEDEQAQMAPVIIAAADRAMEYLALNI